MSKPYLSPTQMGMFCRCPAQYERRYINGEVIPPGIAMLKGGAFHAGAEHNFRQKIDTREDLPAKDVVDATVASFEERLHGGYELSQEEQAIGRPKVLKDATDDLVDLSMLHIEDQAPDYQPVHVEERVLVELPGEYDLLGIVDLIDNRQRVTDFKTSKRSPPQSDADNSDQLTVYAVAHHKLTGELPSEVRLDYAVKTKTKTSRTVLKSNRDEADLTVLANRINTIGRAIHAGSFPPATPGSWWCSSKWCGYYQTCPYVNPKRG